MAEDRLKQTERQEDEKFISLFLDGDSHAFDRLVLKYQDMVFGLCARFIGNDEDGNDAAQETFVKVYRSLAKFKHESAFSTWLYRIAVNTCKNKISSRAFRQKKTEYSLSQADEHPAMDAVDVDDAFSQLARKEKEELLMQGLNQLKDKHRQLIVLRDIEDMSYEEISRITGYKEGTVKSRLNRARTALKGVFEVMIKDGR